MEQCWIRDENSRPRISVVNEAIWTYLLSPDPEDMKSFQQFFDDHKEVPGVPIRPGDFCDERNEDDETVIIPDELTKESFTFESPDGMVTFKRLRQTEKK